MVVSGAMRCVNGTARHGPSQSCAGGNSSMVSHAGCRPTSHAYQVEPLQRPARPHGSAIGSSSEKPADQRRPASSASSLCCPCAVLATHHSTATALFLISSLFCRLKSPADRLRRRVGLGPSLGGELALIQHRTERRP